MKKSFQRLFSVLLGVALWLIGICLTATEPTRGQEVAGVWQGCKPDNIGGNPGLDIIDCGGGSTDTCYRTVTHNEKCGPDVSMNSLFTNCETMPSRNWTTGRPCGSVKNTYSHPCIPVNGEYTCPPFDKNSPAAGGWVFTGSSNNGCGNDCHVYPLV